MKMNARQHQKRHKELHKSLDELIGDFISQTKLLPSKTSILKLLDWSYQQTKIPTKG